MPELPDITVYLEALAARTQGDVLERIVYVKNETNYCAPCQMGGKLLADRALSRLLKQDWPQSLEELETRTRPANTDSNPDE